MYTIPLFTPFNPRVECIHTNKRLHSLFTKSPGTFWETDPGHLAPRWPHGALGKLTVLFQTFKFVLKLFAA